MECRSQAAACISKLMHSKSYQMENIEDIC